MDIQDPHGVLHPLLLAKLCGHYAIDAPIQVAYTGSRGRHAVYRMQFPPDTDRQPAALWIELAPGARGSALQIEAAALAALELADPIPTSQPFAIPPNYTLDRWTAIRPVTPSILGSLWLQRHPQDWHRLGAHLGEFLTILQDTRLPTFGTLAQGGRFVPARTRWKEEWQAYARALSRRTQKNGVDLGPLSDRLMEQINQRLDSLDTVQQWSLVHANLGPQSLEVTPNGSDTPTVVLGGWGDAMIGDEVVSAGALLGLPPEQLASVVAAMEEGILTGWQKPDTLIRVELYHLTWILDQLSTIGDYFQFDQSVERLAHLNRIRAHIHSALEPDFCRNRLEQTLKLRDTPPPVWSNPSFDPIGAQLHMCLATLAANPSLPVQQALIAGASMGACHLADSMDPTDTTLIQGCLNVARSSVVLTKAKFHADDEPIEDLSAWKQGITHQVSQVLGQASVDTSALVLWWMGLKTLAWVEYEVSNGTLRGLERLILASLHVATIQKNQRTLPIAQQLTYAIFGLGAIHGLRALLHTPDAFQSLRERYQEVLHEAALDLDLMSPATMEDQWSVDAIYAGLNEPIANPTQTALRPLMVLALTTMHGAEAIPGGPAWVFQHAGA